MSSWLKTLLGEAKKDAGKVLGINLSPEHAAWCLLENANASATASPKVKTSQAVMQNFASPVAALRGLIDNGSMPQAPCYICLDHRYYNMLLVDAPDVPDQELTEAVKWKVKDLITQDVEKVVVEAFRLPDDAYRGRMNMLYVAVIEKEVVQELVDECDKASIQLEGISVNELAMTALTYQLLENDDVGAAFLYLNGNSGTINLVEHGHLYLTRTIELGTAGSFSGNLEFQQDPVDNLALDVQRSLDYYESQLGKSGVATLYLVAASEEHNQWCEGLASRLPISAQIYEVPESMVVVPMDDLGVIAPALGAALGGRNEPA